ARGRCPELGWHPCLTLDGPAAPPRTVESLLGPDNRFWNLTSFIRRLFLRRIVASEIETELHAQYSLCCDLLGHPPAVVNFHHHLQVFPVVGAALRKVLSKQNPAPYVRRIREPWQSFMAVPGARLKRAFLSSLGRREARLQRRAGFAGN